MKKAFYLFNALTLILLPFGALVGEPVRVKEIRAENSVLVAHDNIFQANLFEQTLKLSLVPLKSSKQDEPSRVKQEEPVAQTALTIEPLQHPVKAKNNTKPIGAAQTFTVTAYTAGVESTGKTSKHPNYGRTYSGTMVKEGVTIACPKSMPIGTKVYIPSLGTTYTCLDRGGAITEGKLDIYIANLQEAKKFGRQKLEAYILDKDPI